MKLNKIILGFILIILLIIYLFFNSHKSTMKITSSVFKNNDFIPEKYTCDGRSINPPLFITDIPENTQSLALIVEDPDAPGGVFTHWLVPNIDPNIREIPENFRSDYIGPCPPFGTHRYFFKIFALDIKLELPSSSTVKEFLPAIQNHILANAELVGKYSRK